MTAEEIIASGLLELYVTGSLSQEEIQEVEKAMALYPSVKKEVTQIETSLIHLSETVGGTVAPKVWKNVDQTTNGVRSLSTPKRNLSSMTGWAAALIFFAGLAFMIKQNADLKGQLRTVSTQNVVLKEKTNNTNVQLAQTKELLEITRSKDYKAIDLSGNIPVSPLAYATVYYNKDENIAYIDAKGLPAPPKGKVYQVWSLIMDPLTPSSIGLLNSFDTSETSFFKVENIPFPEAFGITLEPEGGSESPTLSQLYALGMVSP
ncbi:MAG: anti-sigma factor [Flavobacteriaceae bacterium]|nr:anti-sigma factor [Flavobacteriaceae bacterium]